ncbi:MAG: hypothetical protein R2710_18850 [Acidimicrobiales bacterium]
MLDVEAGGVHNARAVCDAERIRRRARLIGYNGIDARRQRFPSGTSTPASPHVEEGLEYTWDDAARADIRDYNLDDLSI